MVNMEKIICEKCGKVIEGYSLGQCMYMLAQHQLAKHPKKEGDIDGSSNNNKGMA